mgnify:FL=1
MKLLKNRYKVEIYTTETKEVKLDEDGFLKQILDLYLSKYTSVPYLVLSNFWEEIVVNTWMDM